MHSSLCFFFPGVASKIPKEVPPEILSKALAWILLGSTPEIHLEIVSWISLEIITEISPVLLLQEKSSQGNPRKSSWSNPQKNSEKKNSRSYS